MTGLLFTLGTALTMALLAWGIYCGERAKARRQRIYAAVIRSAYEDS